MSVLRDSFMVHGKASADTWGERAVQKARAEPRGGTQKQAAAQGVCYVSGGRGMACPCVVHIINLTRLNMTSGPSLSSSLRMLMSVQQPCMRPRMTAAMYATTHDSSTV